MGVLTGLFLFWLYVLCAVVLADVWKVDVEHDMKALISSCVVLPCSFKYPAQQQPSDQIKGIWHKKNNKDVYIFHRDQTQVEEIFKGRTKLIGSLGGSNCSLEIDEVKYSDSGQYCFRVQLGRSETDEYSFIDNCVSITMIEEASKPVVEGEMSVLEGDPAVFKCSVRYTCPTYPPSLSWSHSGKNFSSYKNLGHGIWEAESLLAFIATKQDSYTFIECTVTYHGDVKGEMKASHPIFVKRNRSLSHILIPTATGFGAAFLVGAVCLLVIKHYRNRIADLQAGVAYSYACKNR